MERLRYGFIRGMCQETFHFFQLQARSIHDPYTKISIEDYLTGS